MRASCSRYSACRLSGISCTVTEHWNIQINLVMSNYCCMMNSQNAPRGVQYHVESKGHRIDSGGYCQGRKSLQAEPPDAEMDGLGRGEGVSCEAVSAECCWSSPKRQHKFAPSCGDPEGARVRNPLRGESCLTWDWGTAQRYDGLGKQKANKGTTF